MARTRRPRLKAPSSDYTSDAGDVLSLRGSLTPAARSEYAQALSPHTAAPSATVEDAWQRATELLFERLAVRWTLAGAPIDRQGELLARYRAATPSEREWVRTVLRTHCAEHFPDIQAP